MAINQSIFKAYDIRGIYPSDINEDIAYRIGRVFCRVLGKSNPKIVVGMDNRLSSRALREKLVQGILDSGADVVDIGLATTPMFYFAVANYDFDGGIIVTASHNPAAYNGFKLVREKALPMSGETGIQEIKKLVGLPLPEAKNRGKRLSKDVLADYINFNLRGQNLAELKPLKVVVDTANAVPGLVISEIAKKMPCEIIHISKKLDGSFPNHSPDPLIKDNLKDLIAAVKEKKADMGVAFDGDGDRIVFVDEKGKPIPGDLIIALLASIILKESPGEKILYDVRSSNIIAEVVRKAGGVPIIYRIGHSFIKEKMKEEKIAFGGEFSGHYYSREHYFCEAPLFVMLKVLAAVRQKKASEVIISYQKYFHSGEINFKIENKDETIKKLKEEYSDGRFLEIDGLRVDYQDWWFLARASNTEPVLRLVIEAKTAKLLAEKKKELSALINK